MVVLLGMLQFSPLPEANEVTVIDGGRFRPYKFTEFDAGPAAGNGLNGHFFPSVIAYNTGRYNYALQDFTYIVRNQSFLDENPRKAEFMSITHYLRGMIYLYHATGVGRHALAKLDFEKAIEWNPGNHMAYLELARIYSVLGFSKEAVAVIDHLLELKPAEDILSEARDELAKLPKASSQ
jgi:tetratricopeptide (TPR) repeat protein